LGFFQPNLNIQKTNKTGFYMGSQLQAWSQF